MSQSISSDTGRRLCWSNTVPHATTDVPTEVPQQEETSSGEGQNGQVVPGLLPVPELSQDHVQPLFALFQRLNI